MPRSSRNWLAALAESDLMELCGWATRAMVQRCAIKDDQHLAAVVRRAAQARGEFRAENEGGATMRRRAKCNGGHRTRTYALAPSGFQERTSLALTHTNSYPLKHFPDFTPTDSGSLVSTRSAPDPRHAPR